jgi:hypothetical protein
MNTLCVSRKNAQSGLLIFSTLVLSGCGWFASEKKETVVRESGSVTLPAAKDVINDGSEVLVTVEGKPRLTLKMFEKEFSDFLEKNQQVKALLAFMPNMEQQFFKGIVDQCVIDEYITRHNIHQSDEYIKDLEDFIKAGKQMLNVRYFTQRNPVEVTDAQVRKYYEEHKEKTPELMISKGGVQVHGVQFESLDAAKGFLDTVKAAPRQIEQKAKEAQVHDKFRDFKLVNAQSVGIEPAVRDMVLKFKTFPAVELVKVNDTLYWVVTGLAKEEPKYYAYEQVKEPLKEAVMKEKQMEALEAALEKLRQEYNFDVNQECIRKREEEQRQVRQQQAMAAQLEYDQSEDEMPVQTVKTI